MSSPPKFTLSELPVPLVFATHRIIRDCKDYCQGVHIMTLGWEDKIPALIAMMSGDAVTPKEVLRETDPATMKALIDECQNAIAKSITMREKKYDDDSVHDVVLEEIEKKEPGAD